MLAPFVRGVGFDAKGVDLTFVNQAPDGGVNSPVPRELVLAFKNVTDNKNIKVPPAVLFSFRVVAVFVALIFNLQLGRLKSVFQEGFYFIFHVYDNTQLGANNKN